MSNSTRRPLGWRGVGRRLVWLGLVPGLFVLNLCLPEVPPLPTGIPAALGCSGAGAIPYQPAPDAGAPPPNWSFLEPSRPTLLEADAPLPVATDGLFLLSAMTNGLTAEEARAQLLVRVTYAEGGEIPGDVYLLQDLGRHFTFGWSARAPLAIGDHLNAVVSVTPGSSVAADVGGSITLAVSEATPLLPEPQLTLKSWGTYYQGTGEPLTCRIDQGCGSPSTFSVPDNVVERLSVSTEWTPPAISTPVAWRLHWQAEAAATDNDVTQLYSGGKNPLTSMLVFADRKEQHCVSFVIEDVRSGETRRGEACAKPGPLVGFSSDTALQQCGEPPSAGLTRAWCHLRGLERTARCAALPPEESAPDNDVVASADASAEDAPGCQLGGSGSGHVFGSAVLAACALLAARRKRKPA